jgi:hypothetical protein
MVATWSRVFGRDMESQGETAAGRSVVWCGGTCGEGGSAQQSNREFDWCRLSCLALPLFGHVPMYQLC